MTGERGGLMTVIMTSTGMLQRVEHCVDFPRVRSDAATPDV